MPDFSVQFAFETTSGVVSDFCVNTWSLFANDLAGLAVGIASLKDFYDQNRNLYSNNVVIGPHTIKAYDRSDPTPRAPVIMDTYSFPVAPSGQPLPHEVAACLSFQAVPASGEVQSRRRGRVYLGPIQQGAVDTDGRLSAPFISDIVTGATDLLTASDAALDWAWNVWSEVNGSRSTVQEGWVDNAFDTQRSRGRETTVRTNWP